MEAALWRGKAEPGAEESSRWERDSEEAAGKIEGYQSHIRTLENELAHAGRKGASKEMVGN